MKNAIKHIYQQPFIFATGIAALIHSTWALGTLFSGHAPVVDWTSWQWYEWIVPALLIAFALDVGQIATSGQIRDNGLTIARAFTFITFAVATYYLQWLFMAVHMPLLDISDGVTGIHRSIAETWRNFAVWILPALLPISTVSYTFSGEQRKKAIKHDTGQIESNQEHEIAIVSVNPDMADWIVDPDSLHAISCPDCDWSGDSYKSERAAKLALQAHQRHCEVSVNIERLELSRKP